MPVKVIKKKRVSKGMDSGIESIHKEIKSIRSDLDYIKNVLSEDFELSESAKRQLAIARKTPLTKYADLK